MAELTIIVTNTKPQNRNVWTAAKGDGKGIDVAVFDDDKKAEFYMNKHSEYRPQKITFNSDLPAGEFRGKLKFHRNTMEYATVWANNCDSLVRVPYQAFMAALEEIINE